MDKKLKLLLRQKMVLNEETRKFFEDLPFISLEMTVKEVRKRIETGLADDKTPRMIIDSTPYPYGLDLPLDDLPEPVQEDHTTQKQLLEQQRKARLKAAFGKKQSRWR